MFLCTCTVQSRVHLRADSMRTVIFVHIIGQTTPDAVYRQLGLQGALVKALPFSVSRLLFQHNILSCRLIHKKTERAIR